MSITVPLDGFGGAGAGTGGTLTVNAPAGVTVTVSKDGKTKTKTANALGVAVFKGLASGTWSVTITDGSKTSTRQVTINADYSMKTEFFSATIIVTCPAGSTCTCTDGATTLTAPDTSGSWECVVPNAGTWTVSCTDGADKDSEDVVITTDGQSTTVELSYWNGELYDSGDEFPAITGGWEVASASSASTSATVTKNDDCMTVKGAGSGNPSGPTTVNAINLTSFSTLHVLYTNSSSGVIINVAADFPTSNIAAKATAAKIASKTEATLDISALEGSYRINLSNQGTLADMNVYKVWLS